MTIVKLLSFRLPTHQAWGSLTPGRFRLLGIGNTISYTTKERVKAMRRTSRNVRRSQARCLYEESVHITLCTVGARYVGDGPI